MIDEYIEQIVKGSSVRGEISQDEMVFPVKIQQNGYFPNDSVTRSALDFNYSLYSHIDFINSNSLVIDDGLETLYHSFSHCVILGMHGIGKKTLLKTIACKFAKEFNIETDSPLPVYKLIHELDFRSKKSLKKSILAFTPVKVMKKIVLIVEGMSSQVKNFQNFFSSLRKCFFSASFSQFVCLSRFQVVTLEPFPVSVQLLKAQQVLSPNQFVEFSLKLKQKHSQISEFCRFPKFLMFFLRFFDDLKSKKRAFLYSEYLKSVVGSKEFFKELELIAYQIIDHDLCMFGFQDMSSLGHPKCWKVLNELDLFKKTEPLNLSLSDISCSDIENECLESRDFVIKDSITEFSVTTDCHLLTFTNIRLIETLTAHYLLNKLEDMLSTSHKPSYIESQEFFKIFSVLFPSNFSFCRKYQEILSLFSQLCPENLFENLIKYLLTSNSIENVILIERLLKENPGNFQHLSNCVENLRETLKNKEFSQGLLHFSPIIRKICRKELFSSEDPWKVMSSKMKLVIRNCNWMTLAVFNDLTEFIDFKDLLSALELGLNDTILAVVAKENYSCTFVNFLLKLILSWIENSAFTGNTTQTPGKTDALHLEDSLKHDNSTRKLGGKQLEYPQISRTLLEAIMKVEGISLKLSIRTLLCLKTKRQKIRNCLIQRSKILVQPCFRKILRHLRSLRVKDEESFRFVMSLYFDEKCSKEVKNILKDLEKDWMRKTTIWLLQSQINYILPAFGFCCEAGDVEVLEILVQYIDNSDESLSLAAAEALYYMLRRCNQVFSFIFLNILRVLIEILTDKFEVTKNFPEVAAKYLRVLLILFKIVGDYKKLINFSVSIISSSSDYLISKVYKILLKLKVNVKYLNPIANCFEDCKFGNEGEFILKIASLNFSWRNDLSILKIVSDRSERFKENDLAKLLVKWDSLDSLHIFCNKEGIPYIGKIRKILDFVEDSKEKSDVLNSFTFFLSSSTDDFQTYYEEFGFDYIKSLLLFNLNSEFITEWILKFIQSCCDLKELEKISEIYSIIAKQVIISRVLEARLVTFLPNAADVIIKICRNLNLKSDELILQLIPLFLAKKLKTSEFSDTVLAIIEKKSSKVLVTMHKLIYFSSFPSSFAYSIHKEIQCFFSQVKILNDLELQVFIESACMFNCSLYFEHIWNYITGKVAFNPRIYLTDYCESCLKSSASWDSKFTLKMCRILGLFKYKSLKDELSQLSTRNNM